MARRRPDTAREVRATWARDALGARGNAPRRGRRGPRAEPLESVLLEQLTLRRALRGLERWPRLQQTHVTEHHFGGSAIPSPRETTRRCTSTGTLPHVAAERPVQQRGPEPVGRVDSRTCRGFFAGAAAGGGGACVVGFRATCARCAEVRGQHAMEVRQMQAARWNQPQQSAYELLLPPVITSVTPPLRPRTRACTGRRLAGLSLDSATGPRAP